MTIHEVYQRYQIMPSLRDHMFRVAGVANLIGTKLRAVPSSLPENAQAFTPQDLKDVIEAALLHDLGNIAKFDLEYFPEFLAPQGLKYWQEVQEQSWAKYGKNAHTTTMLMLDELNISPRVKELVDAVSFNKAKKNRDTPDYALKLVAYSDMRVDPHGVVSLDERFKDGEKRYQSREKVSTFTYAMAACLRSIEKQLFAPLEISPEDVNIENVSPFITDFAELSLQ